MNIQEALAYLNIYNEGQEYFKYEGVEYGNLSDTLQLGVFNFCSCGILKDNLDYIKQGLNFIRNYHLNAWDIKDKYCNFFGNEKAYNFFLYWCGHNSLVQHGAGLRNSWLSSRGEAMLTILNEIDIME